MSVITLGEPGSTSSIYESDLPMFAGHDIKFLGGARIQINSQKLPFKILSVGGSLNVTWSTKLSSFDGFPMEILGELLLNNTQFRNFDGAPANISSTLRAEKCKLDTLSDIHRNIKSIGTSTARGAILIRENKIINGGLGLLLIKNLEDVLWDDEYSFKVEEILNRYLNSNDKAKIFKCQKELIDNGFEEYAKL